MTYALDTNILSFFLKNNRTVIKRVQDVLMLGHEIIIPPMVYYEVRRGLIKKDAHRQLHAGK